MSYPPNNYSQYPQAPPPQGYYSSQPYPPASYPAAAYPPHTGASPPPSAGGAPGYLPQHQSPPQQFQQQPQQPPYQQPPYAPPQNQHYPPPQQYQHHHHQQQQQQPYQQAPYGQPQWGTPPPPPGQYGAPPPRPHSGQYLPQGQYPPAAQGQGHYPPQPSAYGAPPGSGYGHAPAAPVPMPPSLGYDPDQRAPGDASKEADALRNAMKGWGTDEAALINVLAKPDPLQMALIRHTYTERIGRNLEKDIRSETSGDLETTLVSLATGPLGQDIAYLRDALSGIGTDEVAITDVLLGRSNADVRAIKYAYVGKYSKALVDDIRSDLSGKTEKFFVMLLNAVRPERATYFDQASVDHDVRELHLATQAKTGTDEVGVSAVFLGASDAKLVAISQAFEAKYHTSLENVVRKEFTGHLEKALLTLLKRAQDPFKFDVDTMLSVVPIDKSPDMKRLIYWVVRLHWNPPYLLQIKNALTQRTGSDFGRRLRAAIPPGDVQNAVMKVWT